MSRLKAFVECIYIVIRLFITDLVEAVKTSFLPSYSCKMKKLITKSRICVLAVYQERELREDIKILITTLLDLNCDLIVVNTNRIEDFSDEFFSEITYIERPNWGRDFGSYQVGVNYVFNHTKSTSLDRLVILNDSVFYCEAGLKAFLKSTLEGPEAVKAVSENYNIRWHYASYFLSFGPKVFRHRLFTNFWKKYQKTNRRQATIRRGEMALSGCLKAIVGETHLPRPLLNNDLIASEWDKQNLGEVPFQFIPTGPTATVTDLKRPMKDLYSGYLSGPKNVQIHITVQPEDNWQPVLCLSKATTINELSKFLDQFGFETNHDVLKSWFLSYILSDFRTGSQIHNASILAIPCGIPIVKLDVIFRGSLSWDNIESIAMQLPKRQQHEFLSIFGKHRYGASFLAGWRLTGFRYHLI